VSNYVVSVKVDSKIEHKMSDLGYPLSTGKDVLSSKEKHPLLLKWFITFL